MKKITFLSMLFLALAGGRAMGDNVAYNAANGGLPGTLSRLEGSTEDQYSWTSPVITAPEGFTTLRLSFADNNNHDTSNSDFPFVCISEFYLYDKSGVPVPLTVSNFSTNAQQNGEGPMGNICDGNTLNNNYWHSTWSAKVGAPHYLEVAMPDGEYDLSQFSFGWVTRRNTGAPLEVLVTTGTSHEDVAAQAAPVTLQYNYMYGSTRWLTEQKKGLPLCTYPALKQAYGVNAPAPEGTINRDMTEINIACTLEENYPFVFADSYDGATHWYNLAITAAKNYLRYDEEDEYIPLNVSNLDNVSDKNAYRWTFVGNPYTGFEIYNLKAGSGKILSSSETITDGNTGGSTYPLLTEKPVPEGNMTHWDVTGSTDITDVNGFYLAHHGHSANKMNKRSGKLAFWNSGANDGSTFRVEECPSIDYRSLYTTARTALLAPFDELVHAPTLCSAEALTSAKNTITALINAKGSQLTSQSPLHDVDEVVQQLKTDVAPEVTKQLKLLVEGKCFTLANTERDGHPFLTTAGAFASTTTTEGLATYWTLQVVDHEFTFQFLMYNPEHNVYMGHLPNANNQQVPTVIDREDAGKYHILAPTETDNVLTFVHDLSIADPLGLHEAGDGRIVRWTATAGATQWTISATNVPAISLYDIPAGHYLIYHTDDNGVKHYLQIAPDGTLSLTEHPVYSFAVTAGTTGNGYAGSSCYLTMNNHRLSHWNGSNFNTNDIASNAEHCEGLWHSQVIYHNMKTGKYAIRSTNAQGNDYNANTYMTVADNNLASIASGTHESEGLYQWEIRNGYPFQLTLDNADPAVYRIKTGRNNNNKEWWYTYGNEDHKITLTPFDDAHWQQYYWFFKEIKENGHYYLQLYPYAGEGKVISYNNTSNGTDKVSGQDANAAGYDNKWFLVSSANGYEPYALQTSNNENYLSNFGGIENKMGFYKSNPHTDGGTTIYFAPFTAPAENFWEAYIGTSIGQYNVSVPDLSGITSLSSYLAAIDEFHHSLNTENMVKPSAGFYRFRGKSSGHYMDATVYNTVDGGQMNMVTEKGVTNIFYLNNDNKLLSYSNGTYLQNTRATNAIGADHGSALTFLSSEGQNYGFYTLKTDNGGSKYIYDNDNRVDRNSGYAIDHCDWTIEPVVSLPVSIGTTGWASFCAPTTLTIPEGVTVYYAAGNGTSGSSIAVKTIEDVIPAGLPVLLSAEAGTYQFDVDDASADSPSDQNLEMKGTDAGKINNIPERQTYVLARLSQGVGFGRNKTGVVPGFKAYLEPATGSTDGFSISFDDFSTGIQDVTARDLEKAEYYDLSGRRVFFPTRGIYVTNKGEKVFIK